MLYLTLLLLILMIPLSVLAAKGLIARGVASPLRRCFTVLEGLVVYGVVLFFVEVAFASVNAYAAFFTQNVDYLRGLETALISFYWLVVVAAEAACRLRKRISLGWVWSIGTVVILAAHGIAVLALDLWHSEDFAFTWPAVTAGALVCQLHWTNLLLPFEKKWHRGALSIVNGLVGAATVAVAVWALRLGADVTEGMAVDTLTLLIVGLVGLLLLTPAALCVGSVVGSYLKEIQGEAEE